MPDIGEIYRMLHWENPPEVRSEGMRLAREIADVSFFIQPPAPPSVWECCAQLLSERSDEVLEPHLVGLFEWLEDLNWPGALTILERLKKFSGKKLKNPLIDRVNVIMAQNDEEDRAILLGTLSELLENEELRGSLPKEVVDTLQKYRWNFK